MNLKKVSYALYIVILFFGTFVFINIHNDGLLHVYFLDIGQGDAIYIRGLEGVDMLIDAGPNGIVLEKLAKVMPWYDRSINFVIETHPDADHIGGVPQILERYDVGLFLESGVDSKNTIDDEIQRILKEKNIPINLARRGMNINLGGGVTFEILYPDRDVSKIKNTNDASIVGQIIYGSTTVMLTGDSPKKVENFLIKTDGIKLKSNILKAGHHGSQTSNSENFVKMVLPEFVVISAGKKNRYGHPHKNILNLFEKLNIKIFQTSIEGTIEFVSDGVSFIGK